MRGLYITFAVIFIIATLGFVDVEMEFADGSTFKYHGWTHKRK